MRHKFASVISCVAVVIGMVTLQTGTALAHVLAQNNGVSVVMHIAPFDAPEANESTRLEFQFGTDDGTFSLNDYKVNLKITDNGKLLEQVPVPPGYFGAASLGVVNVNFPRIAVYQLAVSGKAITSGKPDFNVSYAVRVPISHSGVLSDARNTNNTQIELIGAAIFLVFAMIATRQIVAGGRYAKVKPKSVHKK